MNKVCNPIEAADALPLSSLAKCGYWVVTGISNFSRAEASLRRADEVRRRVFRVRLVGGIDRRESLNPRPTGP